MVPKPRKGGKQREDLTRILAKLAATQWKQAAVAHRQQEELWHETECHLRKMAEMVTLLKALATLPTPPPPECTDGGEAVEELRKAPRQPVVGNKAHGSLRLTEEGKQLGEGLHLPGAVEETCEGPHRPEEEKPLREGPFQLGVVEETLKSEVDKGREGLCLLEVEAPLPRQLGAAEETLQPGVAMGCSSQQQEMALTHRGMDSTKLLKVG